MTYDILATGSSGNAVVINGEILIDCGVPYKTLEKSGYIKGLWLVLLTHEHSDHFKPATVGRLHRERPALRWGCCEWMVPHLLQTGVDKRVIDVYKEGLGADYSKRKRIVIPVSVPHDVPNCGYKLFFFGDHGGKLFYVTDAGTLDGVEAKDYDLYLIEANHTKAEIEANIAEKMAKGEFAYEYRAAQNHLSKEQALDWLAHNAGSSSRYQFLHQHIDRASKFSGVAENGGGLSF